MTYSQFEEEWANTTPFVKAHTSGSTGTPKEVFLRKSDMLASAKATNEYFGIDKTSLLAIPLSCDYIAGKMMAVRAYAAGCRLRVIEPRNAFDIGEGRVDLLSVVPTQADCLLEHTDWAQRIGAVIVGGAPLDKGRCSALSSAGYNAYVSYGMTETCSHVALARIGSPFEAMPGVTFETDSRGCLVVIAPAMTFGRLVTNDIVELLDEHRFRWVGRYDNVINSGGIKIFPEKLEEEISRYTDAAFYIVGIPDEKWGQAVQMVVEGDEAMRQDLESALKCNLDHKFLPKSIRFVRIIERTSNGKVKRIAYNK